MKESVPQPVAIGLIAALVVVILVVGYFVFRPKEINMVGPAANGGFKPMKTPFMKGGAAPPAGAPAPTGQN